MVLITKGISEDNPNYRKTISCAIDYFCTFDLDALYIAKDIDPAAGRNTQMVLNRIIPVAKDLAKVILPYDHFGQHYDGNNDTIDEDLEKLNYEKGIFVSYGSYLCVFLSSLFLSHQIISFHFFSLAGNALSEMLSDVVIDGNPVVAEFVDQSEDAILKSTETCLLRKT